MFKYYWAHTKEISYYKEKLHVVNGIWDNTEVMGELQTRRRQLEENKQTNNNRKALPRWGNGEVRRVHGR